MCEKLNFNIDDLFVKQELIPTIITDCNDGTVLMLAYMFYRRSRQQLWNKGETSGHFQFVKSIHSDCDNDTLLISVEQIGPACHTGSRSCFFNKIV